MLVRHIAVSAAFLTGLTGAALAQTVSRPASASSAPSSRRNPVDRLAECRDHLAER